MEYKLMAGTIYFPEILVPLAVTLVDNVSGVTSDFTPEVIDRIAEQLYRRHRGENTRKVQERTWKMLPNSEKGKYRKIVRSVLHSRTA
jgi:hypothetical protein